MFIIENTYNKVYNKSVFENLLASEREPEHFFTVSWSEVVFLEI